MILAQDVVDAINIELSQLHGNDLAALHNKLNPSNPLEYVTGGQFKRVKADPYNRNSDES